jgi:hypothetical protein
LGQLDLHDFRRGRPGRLLKEMVKKLIDDKSVNFKFHREPLKHFIMSDEKEALITASKESGLGENPFLLSSNSNLRRTQNRF